ncbi:MAG TPA: MFS transporter [Pirellulales bacterium]|nr:MFS transporter [Pirellulales bacterium]
MVSPRDSGQATGEGEPASNIRWLVVLAVTITSVLLYLDRICISEVLKYDAARRDLHLDADQIDWSYSAFFIAYALAQVPSGWFADRFGVRSLLTFYLLSWSLLTALCGLAASFPALFVLRLGIGLAQAGAYPTSGSLLSRWVPLSSRGVASSVVAFGGRLGAVLSPKLTTALIGSLGSWRPVMALYGGAGCLAAAAYWAIVRDRPDEHPGCNAAERALIAKGRPPSRDHETTSHVAQTAAMLAGLIKSGGMWLMCLSQFTTNVGWAFLITWLPTYLTKSLQVSDETGASMTSVVLFTGMGGMLAGGYVTDWTTRRFGLRWGRILPLVVSRFTAAAAFLLAGYFRSPWAAVTAFAVVAFSTDLGVAGTWAFMQDVGGRFVGAVLGWGNMWGNFGAAVSPFLPRWLSVGPESANWNAVFTACAAAFVISGIASLGIDATKPVVSPLPSAKR